MLPDNSAGGPVPSTVERLPSRVKFIDATRGLAMFLVMLSHFAEAIGLGPGRSLELIKLVTMAATPTFIIISGTLVGFIYRTRPASFTGFRTKLIDRGFFLLTIGHVLILGAGLAMHSSTRRLFITDVIGFTIIVGPWLVVRLRPAWRLLLSAAVYVVSWYVVAVWQPTGTMENALKETFFGSLSPEFYYYVFPIFPWFALDLASTVLGERLGTLYLSHDVSRMSRLLAKATAATSIVGVTIAVVAKHLGGPQLQPSSAATLSVLRLFDQKSPPSPVFLLIYGGVGLGLLSLSLLAERHWKSSGVLRYAATVGQNSLFAYVFQYYVYYTALHLLRGYLPVQWAWPVYFAVSVVLIVAAIFEWNRRGFNQYITVGYGRRKPPVALVLVNGGAG